MTMSPRSIEPVAVLHNDSCETADVVYEKLRRATVQWIESVQYNAFVTLTFVPDASVSYNSAKISFGRFLHRLKIQLFGRNSKKRLAVVPVVEKFDRNNLYLGSSELNTHLHVLIRFPGDPLAYKAMVAKIWRSSSRAAGNPAIYCPDDDQWFLTPTWETFNEDMAGYLAKTCTINTDAVLWKYVSLDEAT